MWYKLIYFQHMKEEVQRKKDEVKNMTMMILNDQRNNVDYPNNNTMILADLDLDSGENNKIGQSMMQIRNNMSTLNVSQSNNLNTTLNFVKCNVCVIQCKESSSRKSIKITLIRIVRIVTNLIALNFLSYFLIKYSRYA